MNNYQEARKEVADLIKVNYKELIRVLYKIKVENSYVSFEIPKRNGRPRVIYAPNNKLKAIQRNLSQVLYRIHNAYIKERGIKSRISHGFEPGRTIITNARRHRNKKYLLNVDISDFFSSFNFGRVQGFFYKSQEFSFSKEVSTIIAQLVCYNGKLPQGAPTSPIISNLIFNIVDRRILELAKKYKLDYTRYVDDMSFSTNSKVFKERHTQFIQELTDLLRSNGFEINHNKTRLAYYSSRQEVTGLTVNNKINVSRDFIDKTRAMAHQLYRTNQFHINGEEGKLTQLEGRFSFINQLDWFNNKYESKILKIKQNKRYNASLNVREKQYQYFLFYKYFFKPYKATIVTEGKTDILHIKAALMKYCDRYPNLIVENPDGTYEFKIHFLNKTKRLEFFLGLSVDGADSMKNIWNFYNGKSNCCNIFEYLNKKNKEQSTNRVNPVILLFDNEQKTDRPLKKFLNYIKITLEKNQIRKNLNDNLYLQTIPLINGLEECEIEDLYKEEILDLTIDGKKFSKNIKVDSEKFFGKHLFSKYIIENYNDIDFSNFLELLDSINCICENN